MRDATLLFSLLGSNSSNVFRDRCIRTGLPSLSSLWTSDLSERLGASWRLRLKAAVANVLGEPPRYQDFAEPTAAKCEAIIRSVPLIFKAIPTIFELAAAGALKVATEAVPLPEVESAWTRKESGRRIVFTT